MGSPRIDLTDKKIGDWKVLRYIDDGRRMWLCRCVCGVEKPVYGGNLRVREVTGTGGSGGCGCKKNDRISEANTEHGHSVGGVVSPEYVVWRAILSRCTNQNNPSYSDYGGRGVSVHPEWVTSFEAFLRDVGSRPTKKHTIDRFPEANGNYVPGNCRWATSTEQNNNRGEYNYHLTIDGVERTVAEWSRESGLDWHTIKRRIKQGWDPKRAVFEPSRGSIWKGKSRKT